jgi:hypothetical protein
VSRVSAFKRCVLDPHCAARTVQGYMARFRKVSAGHDQVKVLETRHDEGEVLGTRNDEGRGA